MMVSLRPDVAGTWSEVHPSGVAQLVASVAHTHEVAGSSPAPAFEIVELLTGHHNDKTYIPRQSARALAQAAMWDEDIRDAYINRVV
jgi:hypothetical protein